MNVKNPIIRILLILLVAALFTFAAVGGLLHRLDQWAEDALFQHPSATSGNVVVVGIDEEALDEYGPFQNWDRTIMAKALAALAKDEDNLPCVVALAATYQEIHSVKWTVRIALYYTVTALLLACVAYHIGLLIW